MTASSSSGSFVLSAGELAPNAALGSPVPLQLFVLFCIGFSGFLILWLLNLTTVKETSSVLLRIVVVVAVSFVLMVFTDDLWPG
mmetsp:Transcript_69981/g.154298  ORF Transcript_69981/g.154298 Transcript_69981/m.154298 type:complete len:84 (+) Transcript_69981:57-308(+)